MESTRLKVDFTTVNGRMDDTTVKVYCAFLMGVVILVDSLMVSLMVKDKKLLQLGLSDRGIGKMVDQRRKIPKTKEERRRQFSFNASLYLHTYLPTYLVATGFYNFCNNNFNFHFQFYYSMYLISGMQNQHHPHLFLSSILNR